MNFQYHKNRSTDVYEILECYWDKKKKQARVKQAYLGRLEPEAGDFIASRHFGEDRLAVMNPTVTATTHIGGQAMLVEKADKR